MLLSLALIGFLGGLITGISPCIIPVLPVIFLSGGAQSVSYDGDPAEAPKVSRWRPYQVILGLVVSFSIFTLLGSLLLAVLNLPQDVLRWAGIVVLVLIGLGLIIPAFQHILEKPFGWIGRKTGIGNKEVGTQRNGILLGIALGAVYVPCAGPVLAAITVAGSTGRIGIETVVLTVTFAIGAALPLLIFALAGSRVAQRVKAFRKRQALIRVIGGVVMIALAIGLVFNLPQLLQRLIPDYTTPLQDGLGTEEVVEALQLGGLENEQNKDLDLCSQGATELESCGIAPDITGITAWFNTPGNEPIALDDLHGQVVLVDFWAYSCINCQRSIPHINAWYDSYQDAGLEIIGVHAPEYAFEKEQRNVEAGAANFGIEYPVAIDNSLSTWTNYRNRYWPAHYLIDADGVVRHIKFGEGGYATTEELIRQLLVDANPDVQLPAATDVDRRHSGRREHHARDLPRRDEGGQLPRRFDGGDSTRPARSTSRCPPTSRHDSFALDGSWTIGTQSIEPADGDAAVVLNFHASDEVRMVLSGSGTITVDDGSGKREIDVDGTPTSYQLIDLDGATTGTLTVTLSPGVTAYSFTFG